MQKVINGEWVDCTIEDLVGGDQYRINVNGGWQQQQYIEQTTPVPIIITDIVGDIQHKSDFSYATVYENTTVVGGVPSDPSKIHIDIPAGLQGSFKAATTFSDEDYYVLTGGFGSVSLKQNAAADFYLEVREVGKVFVQRAAVSASSGGPWDIDLDPAVIATFKSGRSQDPSRHHDPQ